ncbi:MAG TPA: hypothetical protein VN646_08155 [Candidatus Acidoferrum sp.]|jgi:hypothetical protein|nr:hypothetical protein [Candidatus Acidoferrum sp.]
MVTGRRIGAMVGGLGLMLSTALVSGAVSQPGVGGSPTPRGGAAPWAAHLAAVDTALAAGDMPRALSAWHAAYGAALGSRRWDGFADAGDAYLRIGRASGAPAGAVPRARDLYLSALFRARDAGSLDGVLRIAAAFESFGDRDVTVQAVRMARRLAGPHPAPSVRDRLAALERERPALLVF